MNGRMTLMIRGKTAHYGSDAMCPPPHLENIVRAGVILTLKFSHNGFKTIIAGI
jgi:hypothetical protein